MSRRTKRLLRYAVIGLWLLIALAALYAYFFHRDLVSGGLKSSFSASLLIGSGAYLLISSLRGFTLIPVTYLIILGFLFFPPWLLFVLTIVGVALSSTSLYWFAEALGLQEEFEARYPKQIAQVRDRLQRNELPIIIAWSCFPLLPTDVLCYICGALRINFAKFIIGVLIGESATCALYIFFGSQILKLLRLV